MSLNTVLICSHHHHRSLCILQNWDLNCLPLTPGNHFLSLWIWLHSVLTKMQSHGILWDWLISLNMVSWSSSHVETWFKIPFLVHSPLMGIEPRASHTLGKGSSTEPQYVPLHGLPHLVHLPTEDYLLWAYRCPIEYPFSVSLGCSLEVELLDYVIMHIFKIIFEGL